MNSTKKIFYLLLLTFLPFIYSCEDDSPEVVNGSSYENGILLVNQGNFMQGNGSLDFYSYAQEQVIPNVYAIENEETVGGIIENVAVYEDRMFIITNNSDRIIVADPGTLQMISDVEGLITPRYITVHGDKGYVSVWGPYGPAPDYNLEDSEVVVLDLNNYTISGRIPVAAAPEGMITIGDKVFAAGHYSNIITVIDTDTDAVIEEIETEAGPTHFLIDNDDRLWVSFTSGFLIRFNPGTYEEEARIELPGDAPQGQLKMHENALFYRTTNSIYKLDLNTAVASLEKVLEAENINAFNIDPENGDILIGTAAGADPGTIVRFDSEGNELDNFAAGVFPHELIFR